MATHYYFPEVQINIIFCSLVPNCLAAWGLGGYIKVEQARRIDTLHRRAKCKGFADC